MEFPGGLAVKGLVLSLLWRGLIPGLRTFICCRREEEAAAEEEEEAAAEEKAEAEEAAAEEKAEAEAEVGKSSLGRRKVNINIYDSGKIS